MRHLDYPWCETLNPWCSVDAHLQDGAGSVSLSPLPLKAANTSVMTICNHSPLGVPKMQDMKSLTLHWSSFPGRSTECVSPLYDYQGGQYIQKEQWHTIINILRFTVGHLNVTINRQTHHAAQEIGPDGSSLTQRNPRLDRYRSWIVPPPCSGLGVSQVWNQTETCFLSKPGWLAGFPDPLLTLL